MYPYEITGTVYSNYSGSITQECIFEMLHTLIFIQVFDLLATKAPQSSLHWKMNTS